MSRKTTSNTVRFVLGAAVTAWALLSGTAAAGDHRVTVAIHVSTQGLDLTQPADAHRLYTRIDDAAWIACTRGDRVDLVPPENFKGCYEQALGRAVRSVKAPLVTQLYLANHTLQEAAAQGIELPPQLAAK